MGKERMREREREKERREEEVEKKGATWSSLTITLVA